MNLFDVIEELVDEKGLDRDVLSTIVCNGILAAYNKKYPQYQLRVDYDKKSGLVSVKINKEIVAATQDVLDDEAQITLKRAKNIDSTLELGDSIWQTFEGKIGRLEILRAKQVIATEIRHIENQRVYDIFKEKQGEIVHGIIHKCERFGAVVKIGEYFAFLPNSLSIPGSKCIVGHAIRAYLKEVLVEPKNDSQLILDRASSEFLKAIFELEIPEVFEKLVEIKKIVREPGYKSKVVVASNDKNIDPVGTCVGVGGSRIKPVLKELDGEKIDVIAWSDSLEVMVKNALKPAQIDRVDLSEDKKIAKVWLNKDQRSLAIGKLGKNIALAAKLVGVDIQLIQDQDTTASFPIEFTEELPHNDDE